MKRIAKLAHQLIYDNKLLMIVSLIFSVFVWLFVTILLSPTDTVTLRNVPVEINLSNSAAAEFGLEIFGQQDYTVDVEITGKRYVIGSMTSESKAVKVVAQTQYVDGPGKSRLNLKAAKARENDEFEIVSLSTDSIDVYFDTYVEKDFPLSIDLKAENGITEDGYITSDPVLSEKLINVSGPATEVNSIETVEARVELDKPLTQTKTFDAEIVAQNKDGGIAHYLTFNKDNSVVTVTVPIYLVTEKPTAVTFKNAPLSYHTAPLSYTVIPASLEAGVQGVEDEKELEVLTVANIDFADLKPGINNFDIPVDSLNGIKVITKIDSIHVTVSVPNCVSATRRLPDSSVSFVNAPEGYEVGSLVSGVDEVTIVGPAESVRNITVQDIIVTVDLSNADPDAAQETLAAEITIRDVSDCWVYGSYPITLKKK